MSKQAFIDSIKDGAIEGWEKFKILPSITIAQAILESNWGKSDLAVKANNIFGIKGDYNGRKYLHDTWEVDKEGKRFNSTEWFRHYPNIGASVVDHGEFFTSTPWRSNNYKHVIGETDYKIAAQALSDAGYATDPKYADKLINIIETYNLNQWDKKKDEEIKMAKSIIIDPGHGGTDPGAIGFGVREKDWNLRISMYQYERLKELGAKVAITRTSDVTLDSVPRTNKIKNKYDVCISNHWNAFNGSARGIETIHSIFGGKDFATSIANALVKATGLPLRRVFSKGNNSGTDWYFMHRLTGSTRTVIVEYGFLDNATDHNWYKNNSNFIKAAEAVIEAVCKEIGITYKSPSGKVSKPNVPKPSVSGTLYKVQAGAFKNKDNAEKLHEKMENAGIDAFVLQENGLYKVQAGAYSAKANAEAQLKKVSKLVGDGFIVETGSTSPAPQPKPKPKPATKTTAQLAQEVIDGKHGSGDARKKSLGSRYNAVQAEVNRLLGAKSAPKTKTTRQLAQEVIDGKHGSGDARKRSLGSRYNAVQAEVNRLLGAKTPARKTTKQLADEVERGLHGTGDARKRSLGSRYNEVQAEINRRYR